MKEQFDDLELDNNKLSRHGDLIQMLEDGTLDLDKLTPEEKYEDKFVKKAQYE